MKPLIRIKNFKRISGEIILNELTTVNYLVGINGSGKSSVLSAVSFLNDFFGSQFFIRQDSCIEFTIEEKNKLLIKEGTNSPLLSGDAVIKIFISAEKDIKNENDYSDKATKGITKYTFSYINEQIANQDILNTINESLRIMGIPSISANRMPVTDVFETPKLQFIHEGQELEIPFIAEGIKAIHSLRTTASILNGISEEEIKLTDALFILIEEPENNLHPTLQKIIPSLLNELINGLREDRRGKAYFLIATHSPFIISSSSKFDNQKVYLLNDGALCDLKLDKTPVSSGFFGNQCALIVGQMLGADVTDLGYPENYCVIEEFSLQVILQSSQQKGFIKNYQFVSASGESNILPLSEQFNNIKNLNTLIKCNPYYGEKYLIIVDSTEKFNKVQVGKFDDIGKKLGERFKELSKHGLEDYYINIDTELYTRVKEKLVEVKGDHKLEGKIKRQFAELIADKINNKEDWSKLFDKELDFLLK